MPGSSATRMTKTAGIALDRAEIKFNWDAANRILSVPFQILSGGNRITLIGRIDAPEEASGNWAFKIGGGTVVLTAPGTSGDPLVLNRIAVSGRYDATKRRLVVDEGDFGNSDVGVALSGNLDLSGEPRLAVGVAGTRMPVDSLKRIWPIFVSPKVRDWFSEHLTGGTLERIVIAVNAPLENAQDQRLAGARRRIVDRRAGDRLSDPPARRPAGVARRRPQRAHRRPRRRGHARQGDRRSVLGAQADDVCRRVRSARHRGGDAGRARALQARRSGAGRGGALAHGPPARRFRPAVRSVHGPRNDERLGYARHPDQGRSAAGIDDLCDHRRRYELLRRPHDHGPESRGRGAARERHAAGLPAQRRRQGRRSAG